MRFRKSDDLVFWPIVIAVFVAVAAFVSRAHSQEIADNLDPYKSVARLTVPGVGQGTGTLIAVNYEGLGLGVSCRHVCIKPEQRFYADWIWADAGRTQCETIAVIKGRGFDTDMAVFVTEVPRGVKPVEVVKFEPSYGPWTAAGYRGEALRVAGPTPIVNYNGSTIATRYDGRTGHVFVGGMSGGPMFDRFGRIVGIVVASDDKSYSLCSDGPALTALVQHFLLAKSVKDVKAMILAP